jgi:hypothetical protein
MSSSDRNVRKPTSDGLSKDELTGETAGEKTAAEFSLFGADLAEAATEAAAANQLAPEENAPPEEDVELDRKRKRG